MVKSIGLLIVLMSVATLGVSAGVDPTRPLNVGSFDNPVVSSAVSVSFILVSEKRTFAIINGQTVKVGDRVGDQIVMAIYSDRVELEDTSTGEAEINYLTKTRVLN